MWTLFSDCIFGTHSYSCGHGWRRSRLDFIMFSARWHISSYSLETLTRNTRSLCSFVVTTKWTVRLWNELQLSRVASSYFYRYIPRDITVRLGEYDFTTSEETRTLDFMVLEMRIHRDFKLSTYEHDIAIIKIHQPTAFNTYIWPICLPPTQQSFENKLAFVIGQ